MPSPSLNPGWVYILTNPSMPGLVKIGFTTRSLTVRADELSAPTGVPTAFKIRYGCAVTDCDFVENVVHWMLDDRRVAGKPQHGGRRAEFFRCSVWTARRVIKAAAGDRLGRRYRLPARPARRPGRRRRRGRDLTGFLLLASAVGLVAVLVVFKPPLGWLPEPVQQSFAEIERLR